VEGCVVSENIGYDALGSSAISSNAWHNIVFVDNAGALKLYVDGSSYATGTASLWSMGNDQPFEIGSGPESPQFTSGSIDDVRVYDFPLTSSQVTSLDSAGTAPTPSGIFDAVVGQADWQNGAGASSPVPQETYYEYDGHGNVLAQKQLDNGNWLTTSYTHDQYGNTITMTNAVGVTTYYEYSSTYSHAYLTQVSTLVTGTAGGTPTIDGTAHCSSGSSNSCSMSLTTTHSNDIIVVIQAADSSGGVGQFAAVTDTNALAWHNRAQVCSWTSGTCSGDNGAGTASAISEDYAIASSPLTSDSITCKQTGNTNAKVSCVAFAISGANMASPFDSNSGPLCVGESGNGVTGTTFSCALSTSNANDLILGGAASAAGSGTITMGSGFSTVKCNFPDGDGNACAEDKSVSSKQSGLSVSMTSSVSVTWAFIGDAIVASSSGTQNVTQSYTYSSSTGYRLSSTDGNGYTTSYSYDNLGRVTSISYPAIDGQTSSTTYVYNDPSDYVTMTNQNGNVVKQYYDGLARMTSTQAYNGSSLYSTTTYTYNWDNEVASKTLPGGSEYTYYYNQDGQQIKVVNPDNSYSTTSYNDIANTKTATDANGHPTVYAYDLDNNLLSVKQYYSSTGYYITSYTYDLSGNLLTTTNADGATTSYKYNDLNELTKTTYPGNSYQTQSYNAVGEMTGEVNPGGTQLNYTYDALNRMTQISYPGGSTQKYTYDNDGNVLSIVNSAVTTDYVYNARDMVTNETEYISGSKYMVLYGYDQVGNVKSMVYPGGPNVTMKYDFENRITRVGSLATISYTVDSTISKIVYGDGEATTYSYNSMDRPSQVDMKTSSGVKELDLNYTYDSVGNVKTINGESYNYNWLNELTYASSPWPTTTYTYDPAGNMLNQTVGSTTTTYTYGTNNELDSIGSVEFTYDGNGNTHTIVNGSTTWTYNYDYNNRLDQVKDDGATVATYSYDGTGVLVQSVEKDTMAYAYQGDNRIFAKNTGTGSVADYFYANDMVLASVNSTATSYFHEDALGSVRLVTSSSQSTLFSSDYKPFGTTSGGWGTATFEYTSKPADAATGLYYSGARWYNSASARFMTEDTATGELPSPLTLNRYIYALDNPLRYVDPTGHYDVEVAGSGAPGSEVTTTLYHTVTTEVAGEQETIQVVNKVETTFCYEGQCQTYWAEADTTIYCPEGDCPSVGTAGGSATTTSTSTSIEETTTTVTSEVNGQTETAAPPSSSGGQGGVQGGICNSNPPGMIRDDMAFLLSLGLYPGVGLFVGAASGVSGIVGQDIADEQDGQWSNDDTLNTVVIIGGGAAGALGQPEVTLIVWSFAGIAYDAGC
jgi:RHS repeat-associated protein